MKCPKCGYLSQPRDHVLTPPTECPSCGVIYSKYGPNNGQSEAESLPDHLRAIKKPSPVDEASLRTARERVEKRLRKRAGLEIPEDQREQILQLAKQLAAEGVRQRREDWKRRRTEVDDESDPAKRDDLSENSEMPATAALAEQDSDTVASARIENDNPDPILNSDGHEGASPLPAPSMPAIGSSSAEHPEQADAGENRDQNAELRVEDEPCDQDGASLAEEGPAPGSEPATLQPSPSVPHRRTGGRRFGRLLAAAWTILLVGIVGAVLSWTTLGNVQAEVPGAPPAAAGGAPIALMIGFAYLSTGVLGFAFFWMVSMINRQLSDIRRLLLEPPGWTVDR
jgi:hypothetical protein